MATIPNPAKGFHLEIKILYDIEKQLEVALPKMAEAATDPELAEGFLQHLRETEQQSKRLEQIFDMLGMPPEKHTMEGIRGIIADGTVMANADAPDALRDAKIAGSGRDVEHYEMACYMNAIEEAGALGLTDAVSLLEETLKEEQNADQILMAALQKNLALAGSEAAKDPAAG